MSRNTWVRPLIIVKVKSLNRKITSGLIYWFVSVLYQLSHLFFSFSFFIATRHRVRKSSTTAREAHGLFRGNYFLNQYHSPDFSECTWKRSGALKLFYLTDPVRWIQRAHCENVPARVWASKWQVIFWFLGDARKKKNKPGGAFIHGDDRTPTNWISMTFRRIKTHSVENRSGWNEILESQTCPSSSSFQFSFSFHHLLLPVIHLEAEMCIWNLRSLTWRQIYSSFVLITVTEDPTQLGGCLSSSRLINGRLWKYTQLYTKIQWPGLFEGFVLFGPAVVHL